MRRRGTIPPLRALTTGTAQPSTEDVRPCFEAGWMVWLVCKWMGSRFGVGFRMELKIEEGEWYEGFKIVLDV